MMWAQRHQAVHYSVGILGIVAGATAGLAILAETTPLVPIVAAFVGSVLAGIQTFVNSQRLADMHWKHRSGFGRLAQDYETAAESEEPPTRKDLTVLAQRWEEVDRGV